MNLRFFQGSEDCEIYIIAFPAAGRRFQQIWEISESSKMKMDMEALKSCVSFRLHPWPSEKYKFSVVIDRTEKLFKLTYVIWKVLMVNFRIYGIEHSIYGELVSNFSIDVLY